MIKGDVITLKVPCLGNEIGVKGVCYHVYGLGKSEVAMVIFENGEYCGFSIEEQESFFEEHDFDPLVSSYQFEHVIKLSNDFDNGRFNSSFE